MQEAPAAAAPGEPMDLNTAIQVRRRCAVEEGTACAGSVGCSGEERMRAVQRAREG